jgi:hypothetical protein
MSMRQIVAARVCSACCKNTTQDAAARHNVAARVCSGSRLVGATICSGATQCRRLPGRARLYSDPYPPLFQ